MKRLVLRCVQLYLLFALIGRFVEGMGAAKCQCQPTCWCHKPGLSLFRWVFPYGHEEPGGTPLPWTTSAPS